MIGIVLWRDKTAGKSVIWCEDQGDLAFATDVGAEQFVELRVGDWVSFGVTLSGNIRLAEDVILLAEEGCPDLVGDLVAATAAPAAQDAEISEVVKFSGLLEQRQRERNTVKQLVQSRAQVAADQDDRKVVSLFGDEGRPCCSSSLVSTRRRSR